MSVALLIIYWEEMFARYQYVFQNEELCVLDISKVAGEASSSSHDSNGLFYTNCFKKKMKIHFKIDKEHPIIPVCLNSESFVTYILAICNI